MMQALGQSEAFINFQEQISQVAPIDRPVLILGERGTGKELAASRIHYLSKRWEKPFVTLNCSALTPTLIESELFGYEKGAFSGAVSRKTGRFETATGGTLFLDEIGTIPMEVQEKILRVVEYGSFERVGSSMPIHVDVRIVAATNVDLSAMAKSGRFKQDLLDRLSFEVIYVPPLRHRKEDISILANHFAARMAFELEQQDSPVISEKAIKVLETYPWPGNIRELKNVIERAAYKSDRGKISHISFDPFINPYGKGLEQPGLQVKRKEGFRPFDHDSYNTKGSNAPKNQINGNQTNENQEKENQANRLMAQICDVPFKTAIGKIEVYLVSQALEAARYNQKQAAKKLGLTYDQFRGVMRKHSLK
ncbi:MAG: phage shock protein operon transcriptional activator [Pseudomonadota bacterium]